MPFAQHSASPVELQEQLAAARQGQPYLVYRDGEGAQRIFSLPADGDAATVGRGVACDVALAWDGEVSRVHAKLERLGGDWTVVDENLSRNGTFINGERLHGRACLRSGDVVRCGVTEIGFRGALPEIMETLAPAALVRSVALSPGQRRVLIALCRSYAPGNPFPSPASNRQIAEQLVVSVEAVKTQLRALFAKFGVEDLPNNQKRMRLVELAFSTGTVSPRDFEQA